MDMEYCTPKTKIHNRAYAFFITKGIAIFAYVVVLQAQMCGYSLNGIQHINNLQSYKNTVEPSQAFCRPPSRIIDMYGGLSNDPRYASLRTATTRPSSSRVAPVPLPRKSLSPTTAPPSSNRVAPVPLPRKSLSPTTAPPSSNRVAAPVPPPRRSLSPATAPPSPNRVAAPAPPPRRSLSQTTAPPSLNRVAASVPPSYSDYYHKQDLYINQTNQGISIHIPRDTNRDGMVYHFTFTPYKPSLSAHLIYKVDIRVINKKH